MVDANRYL